MDQRLLATFVTAVIIAVPVSPALAWNKAGHMVTGAIAYDVLKKDSPDTIAKVVALLQKHPDYQARWARQIEDRDEADRDVYLFMLATRWSDDVRGKAKYDRPAWHYVNLPFKPEGRALDGRHGRATVQPRPRTISSRRPGTHQRCLGRDAAYAVRRNRSAHLVRFAPGRKSHLPR